MPGADVLSSLEYMQERERIQRELLDMQSECVKEYFSGKLEAITSKEVVSDILKGFTQISNVQFIQSITESILQSKNNNKSLRREIQKLKSNHFLELQQLQTKITEERDFVNENKYNEIIQELKMKVKNQILQIQEQNTRFHDLENQNKQLKSRIIYLQEKLKESDQNQKLIEKEKETLSSKLSGLQLMMEQREEEQRRQIFLHIKKREEETLQARSHIAEADKTIFLLKKDIQSKTSNIQTLQNDLLRLAQQKEDIESRIRDYEDLSQELSILKKDKVKIEEDFRSSSLASKYLREENEFLRQEIISFRQKQEQLQIQTVNLNEKIQTLAKESSKEIETLHIAKINLQQQLKQETQWLTQSFQQQITGLNIQIEELRTFLSSHKEQLSEAKATQEEMAEEIQNLKQQNKCLHEQVKLHFQQNQAHEEQIKCFEGELLKVNQDCRAQLDTFKQTYEINWNSLNEELIEERFKCKQLHGKLANLSEELSLQQEKEKFYNMYLEEISHLKRQLQIVGSNRKYIFSRAQLRFEDNRTKFYYFMSKINEQLKTLKSENKQLKTKFLKEAVQYKNYFQETISYLLAKVKEESLRCSYCQHQKDIKGETKNKVKIQMGFEKTIPRASSNETPSLSNLKKTLKNVQQRYHAINEQNRFYNDHITSMMKST